MAQPARKSTGGCPSRKLYSGPYQMTFQDHDGRPVTTVHLGLNLGEKFVPMLSVHLYQLSEMAEDQVALGKAFLNSPVLNSMGNLRNYWPRVDVYSPLSNVGDCIEHHRREKEHRKRTSGLHIVPNWSLHSDSYWFRNPYRNVILVIDSECKDWASVVEKGILFVQFDLDIRPELEVKEEEEYYEEYSSQDQCGGGHLIVVEKVEFGPDPSIQRAIVGKEQQRRAEEETRSRFEGGDYNYREEPILDKLLGNLTASLWDCTYRVLYCEGCTEGNELDHPGCKVEE
jgi:hypothetical protein